MLIPHKCKSFFTSMIQSYISNRDKVAIAFSNSDSLWTHKTLYANSRALANGFLDLNFIRGDSVLVKLKRENFKEKILLKVAAANLKVKLIESKGQNEEEIEAELKANKARCFMFNPHENIGESSLLDSIYRILPDISNCQSESEIMPYKFKFLRSLIQVDSYQYPGTYSLSKLLRYDSVENYNYEFECEEKPADIREKRMEGRPIVMTDPLHELSFRVGLLNNMTKGKVIFCCFPEGVREISEKFEHQIDIICTEPLSDLHSENRVFVEKGSLLYKKHPRRKEISLD